MRDELPTVNSSVRRNGSCLGANNDRMDDGRNDAIRMIVGNIVAAMLMLSMSTTYCRLYEKQCLCVWLYTSMHSYSYRHSHRHDHDEYHHCHCHCHCHVAFLFDVDADADVALKRYDTISIIMSCLKERVDACRRFAYCIDELSSALAYPTLPYRMCDTPIPVPVPVQYHILADQAYIRYDTIHGTTDPTEWSTAHRTVL
jgi:hypothetical protein